MSDGCFGIRSVLFSSLVLVVGGSIACAEVDPPTSERDPSSDDTPVPDAGEPPDDQPESSALDPGTWESMDFDARKHFMATVVVPQVAPLFREFDPERFAAVSCKTCHGGGAKAGDFKVPNADLPVLHSEALKNPPEDLQPMLAFMREKLKPKMAELLGMQESSSFKCGTCHTLEP